MSATKDVWFKYPEKKPTEEGEYLIIDFTKNYRVFEYRFEKEHHSPTNINKVHPEGFYPKNSPHLSKNVAYWTYLPEKPKNAIRDEAAIKRLEQKIKKLEAELNTTKEELKKKTTIE